MNTPIGGEAMSKILIVDPSPVDRKRMLNILEAAGHGVLEAESPAAAIRELERTPRDGVVLVLTELHFPEGSGLDLVKWIRGQEGGGLLPILAVTPQPPRERVIELINQGVSTVVTKPFGADMLLRRVTSLLAELGLLRQGDGDNLSWQITDYVRRELKRSERSKSPFSVLVCRVRNAQGGRAVPALMTGLAPLMRESDVLAHLGEDQVVVLLPDTDSMGAWAVEDRIWQVVRDMAEPKEERPAISLAVTTGAATFPGEAADAEAILRLAQERAARQGGN
jgi:PleD family two-component response regulator